MVVNQRYRGCNNELLAFAMAMSQRSQYVYGKSASVVDIACAAARGTPASQAAMVGSQPSTNSHADLRQAEYFHQVLEVLRAVLREELAHHYASLALFREADGDESAVRRSQRIIHVKEAELAKIDELTDALSIRFPTSSSSHTHTHPSRGRRVAVVAPRPPRPSTTEVGQAATTR